MQRAPAQEKYTSMSSPLALHSTTSTKLIIIRTTCGYMVLQRQQYKAILIIITSLALSHSDFAEAYVCYKTKLYQIAKNVAEHLSWDAII